MAVVNFKVLRGEGLELKLARDEGEHGVAIMYELRGAGLAPQADAWRSGDEAALIEMLLSPMGCGVRDGRIVPVTY